MKAEVLGYTLVVHNIGFVSVGTQYLTLTLTFPHLNLRYLTFMTLKSPEKLKKCRVSHPIRKTLINKENNQQSFFRI